MSDSAQFNAALPAPYTENWREAYRADNSESPRMASYQAPGGEAIPFIQKGFRFSGGQSRDTAEYPFGGLWSNEYLNEKPQTLTVEGFLRGPAYIAQRNKLIEALRVPTDDDNPGYIDLPFWGRFPVVVGDSYEVAETADEQGQCAFSIPFTRAGVSVAERRSEPAVREQVEKAVTDAEDAAVAHFEASLTEDKLDDATFASGFGKIKNTLLNILGRIQGAQTALNAMTGEVLGIMNLINQGVRAPGELARALFNAAASIAGGMLAIKNSIAQYGRGSNTASSSSKPSLPPPDNEKNVLICLLSPGAYSLSDNLDDSGNPDGSGDPGGSDGPGGVPRQEAAKTAIENLCRTMAFLTAVRIITNTDSLIYKKTEGCWRLLVKMEESISRENPPLYTAIQNVRTALSQELARRELSREMTRQTSSSSPLLYLAHYLGCDEDKIRELNVIADSFAVEGDVIYV
jgi:hypothetical protein